MRRDAEGDGIWEGVILCPQWGLSPSPVGRSLGGAVFVFLFYTDDPIFRRTGLDLCLPALLSDGVIFIQCMVRLIR